MTKPKRSASSDRWKQRQSRDPFVKQARAEGYNSRAAYKLIEIDEKDKLLKGGMAVFDIGAAPGSWSQYAKQKVGDRGLVVAVDLLPISAKGVITIQADIRDVELLPILHESGHEHVDLVISDIAPNITGIKASDDARALQLLESVLKVCEQTLVSGGTLLAKVFEGESATEFRKMCEQQFAKIIIRKPRSSRSQSREIYVLARGYKRTGTAKIA